MRMGRVWRCLLVALLLAVVTDRARAEWYEPYAAYVEWENWARVRPTDNGGLASSYDRAGGNYDWSQYLSPPGFIQYATWATVATLTGPGIIDRFWMPHANADQGFPIRMYFDGETTPRIDTTSLAMLTGQFDYIGAPFTDLCAGGRICIEPIPFAQSLRIEMFNLDLPGSTYLERNYYQYTYSTFPAGTPVESYTGTLDEIAAAMRSRAAAVLSSPGQHPGSTSSTAQEVVLPPGNIPAGGNLVMLDVQGPGLVRQCSVRLASPTDASLDGVRFRVTYDQGTPAAIDASLADLFGAGHSRCSYRSLVVGTDSPDGFYLYWPMPFRRSIRIELVNDTVDSVALQATRIVYDPKPLSWDMGYLHAAVSSTTHASETYHPILSVTGCGHYVGNMIYVRQNVADFWLLEGDELITVDGTPTFHGTGTEDAYNGGYYFNWVVANSNEPEGTYPPCAIRPLSGILCVQRASTPPLVRADAYRWQIADRIPFQKSLEVKIEDSYAQIGASYKTTAWWYQLPLAPGDLQGDSHVDQEDQTIVMDCQTGPALGPPGAECAAADLDRDGDVDADDFAIFQRCWSGVMFADPNCKD